MCDCCIICKKDIDKSIEHWQADKGYECCAEDGDTDFILTGERTMYVCRDCMDNLTRR